MIIYELAKYATAENQSKGRLYQENSCKYRSVFGQDRDRIINSRSFRRLQYKTQVFVNHAGDHYRTRLTHSLEVAQIARWIATGLKVSKDLAEIVSLSHDLGHPPFGHAGEEALNAKMFDYGGFSHNAHNLKIVTKLEKRYVDFDGLNMSWEMIEGIVKHNGPILEIRQGESYITSYNNIHDLDLKRYSSIEAQISAISDDIAYNNHDIEDGIRADLFQIEDLFELPIIGPRFKRIYDKNQNVGKFLIVSEAKREIISEMVNDVITTTLENIKKYKISDDEDVRNLGQKLVKFSDGLEDAHQSIKKFLRKNMYEHYKVNRMSANANKIVGGLFDFFIQNPNCLPGNWRRRYNNIDNKSDLAILVCEYIAGMTDRFAIKEYKNLIE
jgi:dGTPase